MTKTIEERLQILEDERELRDLLARYSFNADLGRATEYSELYTEDGVIDLAHMGLERYEGRDAILERFMGGPASKRFGKAFHHAAPTVFHIDGGDEAEAEGYSILIVLEDDEAAPESGLALGRIHIPHANYSHWRFRRVAGEWKIVERDVRLLGSPDAKEMIRLTTR